jgi:hypothetical protein
LDPFGANENKELIWEVIYSPVEEVYRDVTFPILDNEGSRFVRAGVGGEYDGICEVCHTLTDYYQNDDTGLDHYGGPAAEEQCNECHEHSYEFMHGGGEPDCFASGCHTVNLMHAAHFIGENGPHFEQNETGCYECHAPGDEQCADAPLFKNVENPEGPPQYLSETAVCASALCHPIP